MYPSSLAKVSFYDLLLSVERNNEFCQSVYNFYSIYSHPALDITQTATAQVASVDQQDPHLLLRVAELESHQLHHTDLEV